MACFRELLTNAQRGDKEAVQRLLTLYSRMIDSASKVDGAQDADLYQFVLLRIIQELPGFDL